MSAKLTAHFTVAEVLGDGGYTSIPAALMPNVLIAAEGLEQARALLGGKAITATSWLRTPDHNAEVGGAVKSGHTQGLAVDFRVAGLSPSQVMAALAPHAASLGIDQIIEYTTHVHASFDPRRRAQLLIATKREGADTTYTPWTGEHKRPAVPTATMPQTPQLPSPNAKVIAWVGVAIAILELIRRALTSGTTGVTP